MMMDAAPKPFAMLGDPAAGACEGDACLIPGHGATVSPTVSPTHSATHSATVSATHPAT
jgi:hypothetical protein